MGAWVWGGDGIHSLGSIRARKGVWGLALEGESQSVGFERRVFLSVLWLVQWGRDLGSLRLKLPL